MLQAIVFDDNAPDQEYHQGAIVAFVSIVVDGENSPQIGELHRATVVKAELLVAPTLWIMD